MDEAEAISIANRAHAKKRWAKGGRKERYDAARHMTDIREQDRVTLPRLQDTRTAQVLSMTSPAIPEARRIGICERVSERMAELDEGAPTNYFGRQFRDS